jgi:hypothetical protein
MLTLGIMTAAAAFAVPVAAGTLPGPHDVGPVGRHVLIDNEEYPGANCLTDATDLERIRVRRPIVFARSRTSRVDSQTVGWRWELRDQTFALVDQGPVEKATASDQRAAGFRPAVVDMIGRPDGQWFISVRMLWYRPGTTRVVEGSATHFVRLYARNGTFRGAAGCPGGVLVEITPPPDHINQYGVHVLLDNEHLAPVTCHYPDGTSPIKVDVQGPIALAVDTGPGVQSQQVSWRFKVQFTDVQEPDKDTIWTTLGPSPGFVNAAATERRPAGLGRRSRVLAPDEQGHLHYRVVVVVRWHSPSGGLSGRVFEIARHYRLASPSSSRIVADFCDTFFG